MASIWEALAKVVSIVVSRAVLDLDAELKKPKMDKGGLAMRTVANTVRAINECGLLQPSKPLEVAGVQQTVWKELFSQNTFQHLFSSHHQIPHNLESDAPAPIYLQI